MGGGAEGKQSEQDAAGVGMNRRDLHAGGG